MASTRCASWHRSAPARACAIASCCLAVEAKPRRPRAAHAAEHDRDRRRGQARARRRVAGAADGQANGGRMRPWPHPCARRSARPLRSCGCARCAGGARVAEHARRQSAGRRPPQGHPRRDVDAGRQLARQPRAVDRSVREAPGRARAHRGRSAPSWRPPPVTAASPIRRGPSNAGSGACCRPTWRSARRSTAASTKPRWISAATERARFVVSLFVDALAPTNSLAGNPGGAAEARRHRRRERDARVRELRRATSRAAAACRQQVDARPFAVGKNIATHAGRGRLSQRARWS